MPSSPKPRRTQARLDPDRGNGPAEQIELVDPLWILKALGLILLFALLCSLATLAYFHHYQKVHFKPATQTNQPQPSTSH